MWISVDIGILEHPKLLRTAKELGIPKVVCLGHLTALWIFCYKSAPSGDLSHYDAEDIAIAAEWEGDAQQFYNVLVDREWLDKDDNGVYAHDWLEHAGKYLKRNRQSYDSRRRLRDASATSDAQTHVQTVPVPTVPTTPTPGLRGRPLPSIKTGKELLAAISEEQLARLKEKYPKADLAHEADKCVEWHQQPNRKPIKGAYMALSNWLEISSRPRLQPGQRPTFTEVKAVPFTVKCTLEGDK